MLDDQHPILNYHMECYTDGEVLLLAQQHQAHHPNVHHFDLLNIVKIPLTHLLEFLVHLLKMILSQKEKSLNLAKEFLAVQ